MSDAEHRPAETASPTPPGKGRRRGEVRTRHVVAKVLVATLVVVGMVTGLSMVYIARHLSDNVTVLDISDQLSNRPAKADTDAPREPLNVLVMGSDSRDGEGNNIDGLTGDGARSDTTILMHLSADREHAYGVSIPRDSLVTRPDCETKDGETIPGGENQMWNVAFALGGPACTIQQFEQLTDIRIDHFVVVDFAGFKDMVDAIDGVEVCIPEDIEDPAHGINIPAGTREIRGKEALNYVRARYTLGDGSDIGRIQRQQAFIAAMANKVVSGGTLARPDRVVGFLNAATKSLVVDPGLENVFKIAKLGLGFKGIGLDNIKFVTVPWAYDTREGFEGRVVWLPESDKVWQKVIDDEPLSRRLSSDAINAGELPGSGGGTPSGGGSPSGSASPDEAEELAAEREAAGLCA
ncbi:MAG: LCP family protein [Nocardioides sp.]|nr:LCP family protein [Nocardioides sp.]